MNIDVRTKLLELIKSSDDLFHAENELDISINWNIDSNIGLIEYIKSDKFSYVEQSH